MLLEPRISYAPFEYPKAYEYWEKQQQAHWLHTEVSLSSDLMDWDKNLSKEEKHLVSSILKGFTQSEVFIQEYWGNQVSRWFKKPEIQMMAATFSAFESIHSVSYSYLEETLGIQDYSAFMTNKAVRDKIERLVNVDRNKGVDNIARSLAIFSAFNEGVNLFSSFAVLLNFSRFNKLKGVSQIIAFSIKDETLHSEAGCWLFRTLVAEYPSVVTPEFVNTIHVAAQATVELEDAFLEQAFAGCDVEGLSVYDMKKFIRYRTDKKLQEIGMPTLFDEKPPASMNWFDALSRGVNHADFFAQRVTDYSKGSLDFSSIFEGEK
jgi:ribonucleoside-diphosphate reductase beta chain